MHFCWSVTPRNVSTCKVHKSALALSNPMTAPCRLLLCCQGTVIIKKLPPAASHSKTWNHPRGSQSKPGTSWLSPLLLGACQDMKHWSIIPVTSETAVGLLSLEKMRLSGKVVGGCKADRARLLSVVPSTRTRGSGHGLEHKHFSTVQVSKYWHRFPRQVQRYSKVAWT